MNENSNAQYTTINISPKYKVPDGLGIGNHILSIEIPYETWNGHSIGIPVGRLYSDGTLESLLPADMESGSIEALKKLQEAVPLDEGDFVYTTQEGLTGYATELYLIYNVLNHARHSHISKRNPNIKLDEVRRAYIEIEITDEGDFVTYAYIGLEMEAGERIEIIDIAKNLKEVFNKAALFKYKNTIKEKGLVEVNFYNDIGDLKVTPVKDMDDLIKMVTSIRIINTVQI